jgi:hypothetical protein
MNPTHKYPRRLLPLLLGASLAACDGTPATDPQVSAVSASGKVTARFMDDGMVPFYERVRAVPEVDALPVVCEPAAAAVALPDRLLAAGTATYLGRESGEVTGASCTVDATGVVHIAGLARRTAAQGDVLDAAWTGAIAGDRLALDVTFAGGSGRFREATGWASGGGTVSPDGTSEWTLTGRISLPGR